MSLQRKRSINAVPGNLRLRPLKHQGVPMKKLLLFCLILSITFLYVAVVFSDEAAKSETVNGWVSDSKCGAKGGNAGAEAWTKKCIAAAEKAVVAIDADQRDYSVENPDG